MEVEIFNPELLDELIQFSKQKHAEIVYRRCIQAGKISLAKKIAKKYNLYPQDREVAFGMALLVNNNM